MVPYDWERAGCDIKRPMWPGLKVILEEIERRAARLGLLLALAGLGFLLVERGLELTPDPLSLLAAEWIYRLVAALFVAWSLLSWAVRRPVKQHLLGLLTETALAMVVLSLFISEAGPRFAFGVAASRLLLRALGDFLQATRTQFLVRALEARPMRLVALSFVITIIVGTGFLSLPAASAGNRAVPFVDSLFTATSAVCVTGLIVRSTPHDWTPFGQVVILILIQAGGLGIMALSVSVMMLLGGSLRMRQRATMFQAMDATTMAGLRTSLRYLVLVTLAFEAAGFLILSGRFALDGRKGAEAAWLGLFHSVSAWNNAGFSLWDENLTAYRSDLLVNMTMAALIIAGGLGFAVLGQVLSRLFQGWRASGPRIRWSIHTRLVLLMTASLLAVGTIAIFFVEYDKGLRGLTPGEKLLAAFFHAVSARTAGFNTVSIGDFSVLGLFVLSVLMFIGASPGSTGGGIKTSTLAVMALAVRAMLRNREEVEVFRRRLPHAVVIRAMAIVVMAATSITLFLGLLLALEPGLPFAGLLFETVSAFGTVGLSTGITPRLGVAAKLVVILLMFLGRIGPLTMALAIGEKTVSGSVRYPEGRVVVG